MGNTPTAKKGNEMESGEYSLPGAAAASYIMLPDVQCCYFLFSYSGTYIHTVTCHLYIVWRPRGPYTLTPCNITPMYSSWRCRICSTFLLYQLKSTPWKTPVAFHIHIHTSNELLYCDTMFISTGEDVIHSLHWFCGKARDLKPQVIFGGASEEDDNNSPYTTVIGRIVIGFRCFYFPSLLRSTVTISLQT